MVSSSMYPHTQTMAGNAIQLLRGPIMLHSSLYASTKIGPILRTFKIWISFPNLEVPERDTKLPKCSRFIRLKFLTRSFKHLCFLLLELESYNFWQRIIGITRCYLLCMSRVAHELSTSIMQINLVTAIELYWMRRLTYAKQWCLHIASRNFLRIM